MHRKGSRGFTLIELIATTLIMTILAVVTLPRMTGTQPFAERGYADGIAASLRQSRAVALASGCAVRFVINAAGYQAFQRVAAGTHCAVAGGWSTPVRGGDGNTLIKYRPAGVASAGSRVFVFAPDGTVAAGPITIAFGSQTITVDRSGLVQGP